MEKPILIDLEAQRWATGRKQAKAVQRERLNESAPFIRVMRQSELRYNLIEAAEGMPKSFPASYEVIKVTDLSMRYKATERYSEGWTDPRTVFGTAGV